MATYRTAFYKLINALGNLYDKGESTAIANYTFNHITGLNKLGRMDIMDKQMSKEGLEQLAMMEERLLRGVPIQYITGQEWFLGRTYDVTPDVLIPRPETQELVQWLISDYSTPLKKPMSVLEVGTGSGCIAVSLKCNYEHSDIVAVDVSDAALDIARKNAHRHNADIDFRLLDFLDEDGWKTLEMFDIIISNPPYIPQSEQENLHRNVRDHEPAVALFVPNDNALVFYRAIAAFGLLHLRPEGSIYCELHQNFSKKAEALFREYGYSSVRVKNDMHGAERMLCAQL